ncbi:MAG: D-glycerate dehydrogenase [Candidatus Aminicenantes bacterium]|nr:D-glycerate dehydrogenase [Candidatus Aminicenantes bacterium]
MKPSVLVAHPLLPEADALLSAAAVVELATEAEICPREILVAKLRDKDGLLSLLVDEIDREVIDAAPRLRVIANCAVGVNNIDVGYARTKGILVTNTPGVLTEATADLAWALILAVARRIPEADRFTREGRFKGWTLGLFLGRDLAGRRLGVVGMGRIGRAVARRARAFGMTVVYADPRPLPAEEARALDARPLPLDELLAAADIVTIHCALTPATRGLLSRERLARMKTDAILINTARGPVVDEAALAEALEEGRLWGAGLDVYADEPRIDARLLSLPNVVLLPHIGSASEGTRSAMALAAVRNLIQGLKGERPENLVEA